MPPANASAPKHFADQFFSAYENTNTALQAYIAACTKSGTAVWQGCEQLTRDVNGLFEGTFTRAMSSYKTIIAAKNPTDALETHSEFLRDCFDDLIANSAKWSEAMLHISKGTIDPLTQHASETVTKLVKHVKAV